MIDTHAHLSSGEEIRIEGLAAVVLSGTNLDDARTNIDLARQNPKLLAAVGIHPQEKVEKVDEVINGLDKLVEENENIVAVGECGLDYSQEGDKIAQEILFRGQIAVALKWDKPLIIHARKATDETIEILMSYKNSRGVFHCYSGGKKRIQKILDLGENWFFGLDGNITYEVGLEEVIKLIPKDRLVLETDSPMLTPLPHRGEKNYPEFVKFNYQKVADVWGLSFEETETIIDANAKRLFKLKF